jgi:tRNA G46 methylase TrmB
MIKKNSFLNVYGGPFFIKNEKIKEKNMKDDLCICFTSLGNNKQKGADIYLELASKFFENETSDKKDVRFISIGNCLSSKFITHYKPMDQNALSNFYYNHVDIVVSLDSGIMLNGFPLGVESMIEGCIVLTTDIHNQNKLNNFHFDPFFIIDKNNIEDIINRILFLKNKQNRIVKSKYLQNKVYELFNYEKQNKEIFMYIYTMEIYNCLVKDVGGACPPHKFMYVYNNYIQDKNIKNIVEIGVYNGCFLLPIASMNNNIQSYGIDPYNYYLQSDIEDKSLYKVASNLTTNNDFLQNVYDRLLNNIKKFDLNVKIMRDKAENVVNYFEDNSIDILHIDGNHDYEYVLKDLNLYNTKIIQNGIIIVDDINWKSVKEALDYFLLTTPDFKLIYSENEWCIIQKTL